MRKVGMLVAVCACTALAGCDTVRVDYMKAGNDDAASEKAAADGFTYFKMPRAYILVAEEQAKTSSPAAETPSPNGTPATKPKKTKTVDPHTTAQADNAASAGAGASVAPEKSKAGGGQSGSDSSQVSVSAPQLDNTLASVEIDGKKWVAKVVPMPDDDHAYFVRGRSGFWQKTTIGLSRYANTELVASVSSKAENLVPARIGQIAGAASAVMKVAGLAVGAGGVKQNLQAFSVRVATDLRGNPINDDWRYEFSFDQDKPAGAISTGSFDAAVAQGTVNYWPVQACRAATLTLLRESDIHSRYTFHLVVATPDYIRAEPLPVDGTLDIGTVCGSSTKGTVEADPGKDLMDDLAALQSAVQQLTPAKSSSSKPAGSKSTASKGQ